MNSRMARAWVAGKVQTMTYPNLTWADYSQMPIALPPMREQRRIIDKVNELMALCDAVQTCLVEATNIRTQLLEATIARALTRGNGLP
jgi:type I restriction enzyme S subunit